MAERSTSECRLCLSHRSHTHFVAMTMINHLLKVGDSVVVSRGKHVGAHGTVLTLHPVMVTLRLVGFVDNKRVWQSSVSLSPSGVFPKSSNSQDSNKTNKKEVSVLTLLDLLMTLLEEEGTKGKVSRRTWRSIVWCCDEVAFPTTLSPKSH